MTPTLVSRRATADDLPTLVAMFQQFVASTQYAKYVGQDAVYCTGAIADLINSCTSAVFVVGDDPIFGMLGVSVFVQPFSGEIVASEHFWWLDPEHRGHGPWLLRRAERWAKTLGATRMTMMAPIDKPDVATIYGKLGYNEVERIFQRDL